MGDTEIDRGKMTREQEIEFVKMWFLKYEKEGFSETFWTTYDQYKKRIGQHFEVLGRVTEDESDLECLPMWHIRFGDGFDTLAYPEEIIPSEIEQK